MNLAYFFVPLPEPLGLPDRFVFEFTRPRTYEEFVELDRQWREEEDGDDVKSHPTQSDFDEPILVASLRFWRAEVETTDPGRITILFDIAQRAFPSIPDATGTRQGFPCARTIVEMAVPLEDGVEAITEAFDTGLACLRKFQRGYYLAGGRYPITLASRERMPPGVPFGVRTSIDGADTWPEGLSYFLLNSNLHADTRLPDLNDDELPRLTDGVAAVDRQVVFSSYLELVRESQVALDRNGDYRAAVIFTATAAETLLDDLLSHLLWEEGLRPEEAAVVFDGRFLLTRLRTEYHPRIGGDWGSPASPVNDWKERVAQIRHRVVHGGYEPDLYAARLALEATKGLENFLVQRMTTGDVLARYPRTTMAFLGQPGVRRRNLWSQVLQDLTEDPTEPTWEQTFLRWQSAMSRQRKEGGELAAAPSVQRAFTLLVVRPDGRHYWCLHDRVAAMAAPIPPPDGRLPEGSRNRIEVMLAAATQGFVDEPVSFALLDNVAWARPSKVAARIPRGPDGRGDVEQE